MNSWRQITHYDVIKVYHLWHYHVLCSNFNFVSGKVDYWTSVRDSLHRQHQLARHATSLKHSKICFQVIEFILSKRHCCWRQILYIYIYTCVYVCVYVKSDEILRLYPPPQPPPQWALISRRMSNWPYHVPTFFLLYHPDNKVRGANMGPIWGRQDPGGPHAGHMNLAIWPAMWQGLDIMFFVPLIKINTFARLKLPVTS